MPGNRGGESETIIGRWLARSGKRDKVLIATKVAKWSEHPGLSPENIAAAVEDSLARLQTDVIDLYQAHEDDESIPLEATLAAFGRLIEQGKVRAIGASNYSAARLRDALISPSSTSCRATKACNRNTTFTTAPAMRPSWSRWCANASSA